MATQYTTLAASQLPKVATSYAAFATGEGQASSLDAGGRTVTIAKSFTTTSAVTANSQYIALCKIPSGVKVTSVEFIVPASVGTTAGNLGYYTIGTDGTLTLGDADRWGGTVAQSLAVAGRFQLLNNAADADYVTTSEVMVCYAPTATNFATGILFTYIITYVTT